MAVARHYGEWRPLCQRNKLRRELKEQNAKENHRARKPASLSARRSTTSDEGKHGARSTKQAIAIGLSKARRAGVRLAPPKKGKVSESTWRNAERDYQASRRKKSHSSERRSKARERALKREGSSAASRKALQKQARAAARRRSRASRSKASRRAARTKGRRRRSLTARKAARTRARRK